MEIDKLEKAIKIYNEINRLRDKKEHLTANAFPSSLLEIKVNQCYGDMGKSYTNVVEFTGDIADIIFYSAIEIIDQRIANLEKELAEV